jgi:hypothetical protein
MSPKLDYRKRNDVVPALTKETAKPLTARERGEAAKLRSDANKSAKKAATKERKRLKGKLRAAKALLDRADSYAIRHAALIEAGIKPPPAKKMPRKRNS